MKNTQKAKQFSNRKNRKSKKRMIGGVGEQQLPEPIIKDVCTKKVDYRTTYPKNDITNIEMLMFIIGLLGNTDFKSKVIDKNAGYLNGITSDTIGTAFHYNTVNTHYRVFLNDVIQWLLLDYNKDFFNSVLTVLSNSFERKDFLTNKDPFNVILFELDSTITKKINDNATVNNVEINNNIVLLKIILEVLTTIPNLSIALKSYFQNADNITILHHYSNSMICILKTLITMDIKTNTNVRNLISGYFSDQNLGLFGTIKAAGRILTGCAVQITTDTASYAAKGLKTQASNTVSSVFSFFKPSTPVNTNNT
jgi:hypothetical protein